MPEVFQAANKTSCYRYLYANSCHEW